MFNFPWWASPIFWVIYVWKYIASAAAGGGIVWLLLTLL